MPLEFEGVHAEFLRDTTPAVDLEGALSCGKTTVALCKEIRMLQRHPGMHALIARWTDDATNKLLRPALEQMARIERFELSWAGDRLGYYEAQGNCRIYSFGLRTQSQDPEQRYGKLRGLPVSRIYIDQAEQIPGDIASELFMRMRPDLEQRLLGSDFPRQLTFTPNPPNHDHWLAKRFPEDNRDAKHRKYYCLSLYDNEHNLPPGFIENALIEYPPEHPKHQTMIMGQRGPNIIGDAIFDRLYDRELHRKTLDARSDAPILEALEVGKHNPFWIAAQRDYLGGLRLLGGIKGERLMLDTFLPLVRRYRADWFPGATFRSCTGPMGDKLADGGTRTTLLQKLRRAGFGVIFAENANAPDVQLAMIEEVSGLLARRMPNGEQALLVNRAPDRWLIASAENVTPKPFLSYAFDGGYVWADHDVSVSHDKIRKPRDDGDYYNAMRCVENLWLNFCVNQPTDEQHERERIARAKAEAAQRLQAPALGEHGWLAF